MVFMLIAVYSLSYLLEYAMISVRYNTVKVLGQTNAHIYNHILPISRNYYLEGVCVYCFIMKSAHYSHWYTSIPEMVNFEVFNNSLLFANFIQK